MITALRARSPCRSAVAIRVRRMNAEISWGVKLSSPRVTVSFDPMRRLMLRTVRSGWIKCWLSAARPTSSSPEGEMPTHDGSILASPEPSTWIRSSR